MSPTMNGRAPDGCNPQEHDPRSHPPRRLSALVPYLVSGGEPKIPSVEVLAAQKKASMYNLLLWCSSLDFLAGSWA
jgi:hypothetical protein